MNKSARLAEMLAEMPVVCVLRGITPAEAPGISAALLDAGIRVMEVPLNSPDPFESIRLMKREFGGQAIIGAGTVLDPEQLQQLADIDADIAVSPNTDSAVITAAIRLDLVPLPGFGSATEAFAAYRAGARFLKLFPATSYGVGHFLALKAVLPADARVLAVGGIDEASIGQWLNARVDGIGTGAGLYRPGDSIDVVAARARAIVRVIKQR